MGKRVFHPWHNQATQGLLNAEVIIKFSSGLFINIGTLCTELAHYELGLQLHVLLAVKRVFFDSVCVTTYLGC